MAPVRLDGTTLEGGGQLLRLALGLSSLSSIPIKIDRIRGNRSGGGGLKWQHLTSVNWLGHISAADMEGAEHKSQNLLFKPSAKNFRSEEWDKIRVLSDGTQVVDMTITQPTPGSIGLVFQAVLPYILFSGHSEHPVRLTITGGTNVTLSPSFEYMTYVLLPMLERIGLPPIRAEQTHRGWTTGRTEVGSATFTIQPLRKDAALPAFSMTERGDITQLEAVILAPRGCEKHFRPELETALQRRFPDIPFEITFEDSRNEKRLYLLLVATSANGYKLGRDWLYGNKIQPGRLDKATTYLINQVVDQLDEEISHGGCVDEHLRDQLVVFQALADGRSEVDGGNKDGKKVVASLHTLTAQWVAHEILDVGFDDEGSCTGIGFKAGSHIQR